MKLLISSFLLLIFISASMPAYSEHKCPQGKMSCIVEYNQYLKQYNSNKHYKYGSIENCVKIKKKKILHANPIHSLN